MGRSLSERVEALAVKLCVCRRHDSAALLCCRQRLPVPAALALVPEQHQALSACHRLHRNICGLSGAAATTDRTPSSRLCRVSPASLSSIWTASREATFRSPAHPREAVSEGAKRRHYATGPPEPSARASPAPDARARHLRFCAVQGTFRILARSILSMSVIRSCLLSLASSSSPSCLPDSALMSSTVSVRSSRGAYGGCASMRSLSSRDALCHSPTGSLNRTPASRKHRPVTVETSVIEPASLRRSCGLEYARFAAGYPLWQAAARWRSMRTAVRHDSVIDVAALTGTTGRLSMPRHKFPCENALLSEAVGHHVTGKAG